jgi:tetratricopeptide (TPR) repeat protein
MPRDIYREALDLASNIRDRYLRAVTYAKIGYYFYRLKNPRYKEAFKRSFNALETIENPPLMVRAMIELGTYLAKVGAPSASKVFQQADEIISDFPQPLKDELIEVLVLRLLELEMVDDALFYVVDIEDNVKRNDLLLKILRVYLKAGKMRKARLILEQLKDEPWHSIGSIETIKEHLKREEFGSAIRVLQGLKSEYWLGDAMKEVASYLKTTDVPRATYEKFVEIALGMSTENGFGILKSLLVGLAAQGELEFVTGVLSRLSAEQRLEIARGIVLTVLDNETVLEKLVDSFQGPEREELSRFILDNLLESPPDVKYRSLVEKIGEVTNDDTLLVKVVRYLSKLGDLGEAAKFADRVRGNYLRSLAFGSIATERLQRGDIDGAIDAALEVRDSRWGSWLLSEILTKILELQVEGRIREEDMERKAENQRAFWEEG